MQDICSKITIDSVNQRLAIKTWMLTAGTYTVNFWIKKDGAASNILFTCSPVVDDSFAVNTSWKQYTKTITTTATQNISIKFSAAGTYYIYNMKAEKGFSASDWSPHPEDSPEEFNIQIIDMNDSISVVESKVDANSAAITNRITKTEFQAEMNGVQNSMDRIGEGYDKWLVSVYNISSMSNLNDGKTAIANVYDITAFSDTNANVAPENELLIDDNQTSLYTPISSLSGKILYYLTYVNFTENTKITTNFTHGKATLYLNGVSVLTNASSTTHSVILNFVKGWNVIEIVTNNSGAKFAIDISKQQKCYSMNCLMATPNARSVRIKRQFSNVNQYIDKIEMNVGESIDELSQDLNGKISTVQTNLGTYYTQTNNKFSWIITNNSTSSSLTFTDNAITAVVNKFQVVDPEDSSKVVISKGAVVANSVTAKMLNADAVRSNNFVQTTAGSAPYYSTKGTKIDLSNGNIISPSLYMDGATGNAWFKGNINAANGNFSGTLGSKSGTIGPWNITETSLWKGSGTFADGSGAGNIYLGNYGMSFGNKLVYDASKGTLTLNVSSLSVGGGDISEYVTAYNGNNVFYSNGIPTLNNYPYNTWTNEADKIAHIDDLCYDTTTGKLFKFTKIDRRIKIKFNSQSATQSRNNDYIWIYYQKDGARYRTGYTSTTALGSPEIAGASIVIPSESFWIYWHSDANTTGWGFKIDSVTATSDSVNSSIASNLPSYTQRKLKPGEFPETSHPYNNNENMLWYVRPVISGGTYQWQEVSVDSTNILSMSDFSTNGVTLNNENFIVAGTFGQTSSYIRIPDSVFHGNKSYCISFKFNKNAAITSNNTLSNIKFGFSNFTPYYAVLDSTDILSSINSNITLSNNTAEHTVKLKVNKTGSGYIDIYFNNGTTTSVSVLMKEIMVQEGMQFTDWQPSKKDLVSTIISSKQGENNYMYYDAASGLVIYDGRNASGSPYIIDGTTNTVSGLARGNIRLTSTGMDIYSGQNKLASYGGTTYFYKSGTTTVAATLDANGLHISNGSITLGSNFSVDSNGTLYAATGTFKGKLEGATGTFSGELSAAEGTFKGELSAAKGSFSGTITAESGYIGKSTNKITLGNGSISYGMTSYSDTSHNGFWISSDGIALGKGAFKVSSAGALTSTSADIKGKIVATSGSIGSGTSKITLGEGQIFYGKTSYSDTTNEGFWISSSGISLGKGAFSVSKAGTLTSTDANIKGEVTATSGEIGSFYIGSTGSLYSNNRYAYNLHNVEGTTIEPNGYIGVTFSGKTAWTEIHNGTVSTAISSGAYGAALLGAQYNSSGNVSLADPDSGVSVYNSSSGVVFRVSARNGEIHVKNNAFLLDSDGYLYDRDSSGNRRKLSELYSGGYGGSSGSGSVNLTSVNSDILPSGSHNIGSSSNKWNEIHATTVYQNGTKCSLNGHTHTLTKIYQVGSMPTKTSMQNDNYVVMATGSSSSSTLYLARFRYSDFEGGFTDSSIRFKNVSRNLQTSDIEKFYNIKPVLAKYKDNYLPEDHYWQGVEMPMLIAEDIEKVYPKAVEYDSDGQVKNYSDHLVVSVHQQMLIDQKKEIDNLKKKIFELENIINKGGIEWK